MRPSDYLPDELKGVRSAPVPGYPGVRADEDGNLWRRGEEWVRIGTGPKGRVTLRSEAGKRVGMAAHKAVCMAWHGVKPSGWCVRFRNLNPRDLRPKNLEWVAARTGRPRKLTRRQQREALGRAGAGEMLTALAGEFGVSVGTMTHLCKGYVPRGVSVAATRQRAVHCGPEQRAEAVRQVLAGRKPVAVALRFGLSPTRLGELVKRARAEVGA